MAFDISRWEQAATLLYALMIGIAIGALYDIFRLSRVMLTGVGIGANKTSSRRVEAWIRSVRKPGFVSKNRTLEKIRIVKDRFIGVIIFFEDILFFVICALLFAVFLFEVNFGELRLYIYLGAAAGFLLYYNTLGRISAALSGVAVSLIRLVLTFMFYKIAKPFFSIIAKAISVPVDAYTVRSVITSCDREAAKLFVMAEKGFGFNKSAIREDHGGLSTKSSERRTRRKVRLNARHEAGNEKNKRSG